MKGEIDIATGERVYMTYEHQLWLYHQNVRSRPSFKEDDPRTLEILNSSLQFKTMEEIQELRKLEKNLERRILIVEDTLHISVSDIQDKEGDWKKRFMKKYGKSEQFRVSVE